MIWRSVAFSFALFSFIRSIPIGTADGSAEIDRRTRAPAQLQGGGQQGGGQQGGGWGEQGGGQQSQQGGWGQQAGAGGQPNGGQQGGGWGQQWGGGAQYSATMGGGGALLGPGAGGSWDAASPSPREVAQVARAPLPRRWPSCHMRMPAAM